MNDRRRKAAAREPGPAASSDVHALVEHVLRRVVGAGISRGGLAPLPGISHRSFRVDTDRGTFVVKLREAGAAEVLDLAAEFRVHARAAAAGVAPEAIGYAAEEGALVTRFVEGSVALGPARIAQPETITSVARLLDALHGVAADGVAPFGAEAHARRYVDAAQRARELDAHERSLAAELVGLGSELDALGTAHVLCHADLVASNVLDSGRLWLIDFEYAAAADPVLDLASVAAMNRFDAERCRMLLAAYDAAAGRPWSVQEFAKVVRLLNLLAYFWAEAEAGRTGARTELEAFRRRDEL